MRTLVRFALIGILVSWALTNGLPQLQAIAAERKVKKEFRIIAAEWDTTLKKPINDRGTPRKEGDKVERYSWDPAFIVVNKGDAVTLKIHAIKGDVHDIDIPGINFKITGRTGFDGKGTPPIKTKPEVFVRGEEITVEFVADKGGLFEIMCSIHDGAYAKKDRPEMKDDAGNVLDSAKKKGDPVKGPMVGYLLVLK